MQRALGNGDLGLERCDGGIGEEEVERTGGSGSDNEGLLEEVRGLEGGNAGRRGPGRVGLQGEGVLVESVDFDGGSIGIEVEECQNCESVECGL